MKQSEKDVILRLLTLLERELFSYQQGTYEDVVRTIESLPVSKD